METVNHLYRDIAARTGGDVYLGVVGPVRTGKSTFIKRFMDMLVIPHMADQQRRERAKDELPQSAAGRTIMTTEPKFMPEQAARVCLDEVSDMRVRLIDCVGYIVPSAMGYIEEDQPRMVKTPWYEEEIPFNMAAEEGTRRVITDHSTVGLVVTTDGSITDIPRAEYAAAEERVVRELQALNKPFSVLLNAVDPHSAATRQLAAELSEKYGVPVLPVNCQTMTEPEIRRLLEALLSQFPVQQVGLALPRWLLRLERGSASLAVAAGAHPSGAASGIGCGSLLLCRRESGRTGGAAGSRDARLLLRGERCGGSHRPGEWSGYRYGDGVPGIVLSNIKRDHRPVHSG